MPQFGTRKRQNPRIEVLRGFNPNEPHTMSSAHPVGNGVIVLSGQVVYKLWNGTLNQYEWQLGCVNDAVPHFALNDSGDEDVIESGTLNALSCAGQFELQTAFFTANQTYNDGVPLTYDGVTGNVKPTTNGSGAPILGFVSKIHGVLDVSGINSNVVTANAKVVQLVTNWQLNAGNTP